MLTKRYLFFGWDRHEDARCGGTDDIDGQFDTWGEARASANQRSWHHKRILDQDTRTLYEPGPGEKFTEAQP